MDKQEKLFEDLQARLEKEDFATSINAVFVLYVSFVAELAKVDEETAKQLMEKINETIKEEAGWTE